MTFDQAAVVEALQEKRRQMKAACAGIGEPCVELPMQQLKVYKDNEGEWHAILGMDQLVYLVDELLR